MGPTILPWVWLKIKELGLRKFWSLVPFAKVTLWYMFWSRSPIPMVLTAQSTEAVNVSLGPPGQDSSRFGKINRFVEPGSPFPALESSGRGKVS